jgi:glycogen synthase
MKLNFSIVINTYNRAHTIRNTLESLEYLRNRNFEVVVVNGPSTDDTELILDEYKERIKYLKCDEANLSKSRNIGINASSGDIVCFIDDDAIPEPSWLDNIEAGYTDENIGAVGGFIRDHTGYIYQSRALVCDRFGVGQDYPMPESSVLSEKNGIALTFHSLTGTNCTFKRKILLEIGGFDEEYAYFLDETDVVVRLIDAGYKVKYVPAAEIHHKYASSHLRTADKIPKSIYLPARSKAYFCIKNALPVFGIEKIMNHLEKYRKNLRADYDWYLQNNKIDALQHKTLHDDIDRGIHDGISDGYKYTERQLLKQFKVFTSKFKTSKVLKICFLSQSYPPNDFNGISVWTHTLATSLAQLGHEVTVVSKASDHNTVDFIDGVWVHRIVPIWQPNRTIPILPDIPQIIKDYSYSAYDEVMRVHAIRGLDVVSSPIWDLEGIACISDGSIKNILSLHTTFKLALPSKPEWIANADYKLNHVDKIIEGEKWLLENSEYIMANSRAVVKDLEEIYNVILQDKAFLVPHGINNIDDNELIFDMQSNNVNLLFVGRFEKRKGIDLLLSVLPKLMESYQNLTVTLVGDHSIVFDQNTTAWENFSKIHSQKSWFSRIEVPGIVSNNALHEYYKKCDIFVAPSRYESFGLIFLEAMRYGKPCIGTNVGGIPEIINHDIDGLLIDNEDTLALSNAIVTLLNDREFLNKLAKNALSTQRLKFSNSLMAENALNEYSSIVIN